MANDNFRKIGAGSGLAALRQGANEIGVALKAFPDSIQVQEPGTLFNPTQGEIAEGNRNGNIWGRVEQAREKAAEPKEPDKGLERD